MRLVLAALSRPLAVIVALIAILTGFALSLGQMRTDIFPEVGNPVIYVAQPYGGMTPAQMEGFLTYYYEYHFLYITGIQSVDSKSVQGAALMKLTFREGTNMQQAMAETVGYVNRARAFMPPGTVPPLSRVSILEVLPSASSCLQAIATRKASCRTSLSTRCVLYLQRFLVFLRHLLSVVTSVLSSSHLILT